MKKAVLTLILFLLFGVSIRASTGADAVLTWTAPSLRVDGTPLTDLTGYRIKYGTASGVLTQVKPLTVAQSACAAGVCTNTVTGFASDDQTWYFVVTAITATGLESAPSNEASKKFNYSLPSAPTGCTVQ